MTRLPRPIKKVITLIVALTIILGVIVAPVGAATTTSIEINPRSTDLAIGETTTIEIVVGQVDGGVGAWAGTVNLSNGEIGEITQVTLHGNPDFKTVDISPSNDSVYFDSALANTTQTGSVAIVSVTIRGTANGKSKIRLNIDALGDELGNSYTIIGSSDGTLTVGNGSSAGGGIDGENQSEQSENTTKESVNETISESSSPTTHIETVTPIDGKSTKSLTESEAVTNGSNHSESTGETSSSVPGFRFPIGVLAIILIGLMARRRTP